MTEKKTSKLTIKSKLEIIEELSKPKPSSKRSLARRYNVTEGSIRYIWSKRKIIKDSSSQMSDTMINNFSRTVKPQYADLEDKLYSWIETLRLAKIPLPPSLVISKAKALADQLLYTDFKASWCWYNKFKIRKGLMQKELYGEGGKVDKDDPNRLAALELQYQKIVNSEVDSTNMSRTSENNLETDEETFSEQEGEFEFEGFKPMLMKIISFNAQLCSPKAVTGAGEHYEELKATCEKFQQLLCKASVTEEKLKLKKNVK